MITDARRQTLLYSAVVGIISCLLAAGGSVWYSARQAQQTSKEAAHASQQQWCELIITLDGVYQQSKPTTEAGRKVATEIHTLRTRFECDRVVKQKGA